MHIACLDTESTSTGRYNEILELAIYSARGELILNSLYKPKKNRRWPHSEKVHGISPDMVQNKPHFQDCLRKIQKIFDRSQMILGFALDNDVRILEQSGVQGLTPERCLDVRELFWGVYRDELQMDFYHVPSLIKCADFCGYVWEEGSAHSAAADAKATLYCYEVLMRKFITLYKLCPVSEEQKWLTDEQIRIGWKYLHDMVAEEMHRRMVEKAKGWLYLIDTPDGTLLVARRKPYNAHRHAEREAAASQEASRDAGHASPEACISAASTVLQREQTGEASERRNHSAHGQVVAGIHLADFAKGYEEMCEHFRVRQLPHSTGEKCYYQLEPEDLAYFNSYSNVFEA